MPEVPASAEQRGGCERLCFPLLPGQILSPDKIDGDVQNMERLADCRMVRGQLVQLDVVVGIEPRKEVWPALLMVLGQTRGSQVCPDEPVAIDRVQGKLVDVDNQRQGCGQAGKECCDFNHQPRRTVVENDRMSPQV